jgi:hypothetical protein
MLSLEIIVVLALLYCFFMYATLRASCGLPTIQVGRVPEGKLA